MPRAFVVLILLVLTGIIVPFILWGEAFQTMLDFEGALAWMEGHGSWAWAAGMGLIIADIALPIPGTVVMSVLGWMYGWLLGGAMAAAGSFLSGVAAYCLCRGFGRPVARWIAGEEGLRSGERLFAKSGGWLVALSRWTPVLPEAVACLAGLVGMPWRTFVVALACGSVPLGFAFAAIGHLGQSSPLWALGLSAMVPAVLWMAAGWAVRR